ncbi:22540_t:CDS:2 [Entrophospora sp. SA101]|nr:9758_t:CDS:2 [Entrophospora sp. SA101]CAJ0746570.1 22540_t:CDS:2 [Entrophospora sp. SA101]
MFPSSLYGYNYDEINPYPNQLHPSNRYGGGRNYYIHPRNNNSSGYYNNSYNHRPYYNGFYNNNLRHINSNYNYYDHDNDTQYHKGNIKLFEPEKIARNRKIKATNGKQVRQGSCSQTIQGEIPSVDNMPSTLIIEPMNGQTIKAHQSFRIRTKTSNLITGFFTDPNKQYYVKPQQLKNGMIKGHSHITIQKLDGNNLPDARDVAFFKGLDQPDDNGILSVKAKGLSPGDYRICTIVSSFSHQPVIMPIAKRGSQDDYSKVLVIL